MMTPRPVRLATLATVSAALAACMLTGCQTKPSPTGQVQATFQPPPTAIRIRAGSTTPYTDARGNLWLGDRGFTGGETIERVSHLPIANTVDAPLYRAERYSMTAFAQPVPNGRYNVRLHFAETYEEITAAGQRVFSFAVEGQQFKDFDVFAKAGGAQKPYIQTVNVQVSDGRLDIQFDPGVQNPEINGIEILPGT